MKAPYYKCGTCGYEFYADKKESWPSACPKCGATDGRKGIHKVLRVDPIGAKFKSFIP